MKLIHTYDNSSKINIWFYYSNGYRIPNLKNNQQSVLPTKLSKSSIINSLTKFNNGIRDGHLIIRTKDNQ